jgi:hypothetical protein
VISTVEVLNISPTQTLHHCGNTSKLFTRHEHVNVVSHENVGVYLAVTLRSDLPQDGEIKPPIFIISKTNRAINATLEDVLRDTCYIDSRMPNNNNAPEMKVVFFKA